MSDTKEEKPGMRIFMLRNEKGYSREYLAEKAGISGKFLYEIEVRGRGFSSNVLAKLAVALDVTTDYILFGKSQVKYDKKLAAVLEEFQPDRLESVKRLLDAAYELAKTV